MNDDWQSQKFRQNVIAKINEFVQNTDTAKNPAVMESHIFKKSKSREEYLGLLAKLFLHFKDISNRQGGARPQQQPQTAEMGGNVNMMQDPINALQNLASQGTRQPQMMGGPMGAQPNQIPPNAAVGGNVAASNLLQTLNQQRPGQQMQNMQGIRGPMNVTMGANGPQGNVGPNTMAPQMAGGNMGNMNPGMTMNNMNVMANQPNQMGGIGQMNQMPQGGQMQMNPNMQGQPINQMNVQQMPMQQMNQNQMNMGINHPQMNQMMNRMGNNPQMNVVPNIVNQNQMPNQMNVPQNMPNMPNQGQIHPAVSTGPQVGGVGMPQNQGPVNAGGNMNQMINMPNMQQKPQTMPMGQTGNMFQVNRNVGQGQFMPQSPSQAVNSPVGMGQQQPQQPPQQQSQLPNPSQMIPSPSLVPSASPQMSNIMANNQRSMRQSPNAPLNTPGQVASSSPFNPQEDQMYREKYKQLTKYIEPLKRMVARIGNDDVEKITKMNKLLEILSNPHQRIPLETLLKCEKALEKMDFKSTQTGAQFGTSNPLMEVLSTTLQSPIANHSLYRTFHPCLESLFGTDIKCAPAPAKQRRLSNEENQEIPHVLQGEIARLDQKFKVSLDPSSQNNNKGIKLICGLDDKRLPCVPPISVNIPEEYPFTAPNCSLTEQEYSATPFLLAVQSALTARITKLPKCHSLSHLLDTWEMSVRQACSPNAVAPNDITAILGM